MKIKEEKSECVSVHVRIRPFTDKEPQDSSIEILDSTTNAMRSMFNINNIYILIVKRDFDQKDFSFNTIFQADSNQEQIFNKVGKPVVEVCHTNILIYIHIYI